MSAEFAGIGEARLAGIGEASLAIAKDPERKGNKFVESFGNHDISAGPAPTDPFKDFLATKMGQVAANRQGPKGD